MNAQVIAERLAVLVLKTIIVIISKTSMADKIFADGFSFRSPAEGAPSFVLGRLSCKADKAIAFLQAHADERGWVNMKILLSKGGTEYIELDTYKKLQKPESLKNLAPDDDIDLDSIPF